MENNNNNEEKDAQKKWKPGTGIAMGIAIGSGVGVALGNIAIGVGIGVAIGAALEVQFAEKQPVTPKKKKHMVLSIVGGIAVLCVLAIAYLYIKN